MQLRLEQASVDGMKKAMAAFFPHYLNVDLQLPKEYHYTVGLFLDFLSYKIDWTDITYDSADLDIQDTKIHFTRGYDLSLLNVVCPAVKSWKISANQKVNTWILPSDSKVDLEFKNLEFEYQVDLKLTDKGYLKPIVYDVSIKFGDSYFYHEDQFIAFIMHQFIYFSIVIIENSVYFVGEYIFTNMMGPIMDNYLNHYNFDFTMPSPLPG
jgi:hypothetical protein